jgi:hypothetical protein
MLKYFNFIYVFAGYEINPYVYLFSIYLFTDPQAV